MTQNLHTYCFEYSSRCLNNSSYVVDNDVKASELKGFAPSFKPPM